MFSLTIPYYGMGKSSDLPLSECTRVSLTMGMITAHSGNLTYTRKKAIGDPSIDAHCTAGLSPTQRHVACSVLPSALFDTVFQGVKGKTHAFKFVLSYE